MAKVFTDVIVIKLSKLVKDNDNEIYKLASDEIKANLEDIVQELVGDDVLVEIEKE